MCFYRVTGEGKEDVIDEQEMENYLMTVMAVQKLMQNELTLLSGIIPVQHQHQVFQIIIQEALDEMVQDGEVSSCILFVIFRRYGYRSVTFQTYFRVEKENICNREKF